MANECRGVYSSTLTVLIRNGQLVNIPLDDGDIEIDAHTGAGFTGRRRKSNDPLPVQQLVATSCLPTGGGVKIRFIRQAVGEVVHYDGTLVGGVIKGIFFITSGPPDPGDQGTWVAQQGGNFGEGEDNYEQGEGRGKGRVEANNPRQSKYEG